MEIHWPLVFYTLLVGAGVGVFSLVAISELKGNGQKYNFSGSIISVILLVLGGFSSFLHLKHPERAVSMLGNYGSPITQELYLAIATGAFICLYIVMVYIGASAVAKKVMAALGLIFGVALAFFSGLIYVFPARPAWNTVLLPSIYFTSSISLGIFIVNAWINFRKYEDSEFRSSGWKALFFLLAVQALLIVGYLVFLSGNPYPDPARSVTRLVSGDLAVFFWLGVVLLGLALPLFLAYRSIQTKASGLSPLVVGLTGILATLVGGVAFRSLIYLLGTTVEKF